jgi:hypothetical protein
MAVVFDGEVETVLERGANEPGLKPGPTDHYAITTCDNCEVVTSYGTSRQYASSTEALEVWREYGNVLLEHMVRDLWKELWDITDCTGACKIKKSCSDQPSYIKVTLWKTKEVDAQGQVVGRGFVFAVTVQRKIKCVTGPKTVDDEPRIPMPPVAKPDVFHSRWNGSGDDPAAA